MKYINILILSFLLIFIACGSDDEVQSTGTTPTLTVSDVPVIDETDEDFDYELELTLDSEPSVTSSVSVSVEQSTATATINEDFRMPNPAIIQFAPGETQKTLNITIVGDDEIEDVEEFFLNFSDANGIQLAQNSVNITIRNDDEKQVNDTLIIPSVGYTTPLSYPGMDLIWQDEFDGTELDLNFWTFEIGRGNSGWGNNELQFYQEENTYFRDGNLVIEARELGTTYTSSRIITKDKFDFTYGRVDIRAVLPEGQGIWPALWMLGDTISDIGWPRCGEIDIMELVGGGIKDSEVHGTAHYWKDSENRHDFQGGVTRLSQGKYIDEFHVFSVIWDSTSIQWYDNDQLYYSFPTSDSDRVDEFNERFFFIFNVAVGGNWPGSPDQSTIFPQRMIVDYIRVFQDQ